MAPRFVVVHSDDRPCWLVVDMAAVTATNGRNHGQVVSACTREAIAIDLVAVLNNNQPQGGETP